jgi:hypothetical protein
MLSFQFHVFFFDVKGSGSPGTGQDNPVGSPLPTLGICGRSETSTNCSVDCSNIILNVSISGLLEPKHGGGGGHSTVELSVHFAISLDIHSLFSKYLCFYIPAIFIFGEAFYCARQLPNFENVLRTIVHIMSIIFF